MMAGDTRVAGIYSEIKYKFDPKSLRALQKFKKDITALKKDLKSLNKIRANPKVTLVNKQQVVQAKQKSAQQKKANDLAQRELRIKRATLRVEQAMKKANMKGFEKGTTVSSMKAAGKAHMTGRIGTAEYNQRVFDVMQRLNPKIAAHNKLLKQEAAASKQATKSLTGMWRTLAMVAKQQDRANRSAKKSTMTFKQLRGQLVGMIQAYTAFSALSNINRVGQEFENAGIMMEVALKDHAGPAMNFLIHQSKRLGIDAAASAKGFARYSLAARELGFSFEDIQQQFLGVAEAATVFGLAPEEITGKHSCPL